MKCQELSVGHLLKILCCLLSLCKDDHFHVTIGLNEGLDMFHHTCFVLDYNCLINDAFRDLVGIISDEINQYGIFKSLLSQLLNESWDCRRKDHTASTLFTG